MSKVAKQVNFLTITFDTQTVMHNSFNFGGGLLAQLKQFAGSPIQVIVSEIVVREIHRHLAERTADTRKRLRSVKREARELGLQMNAAEAEPEIDPSAIAQERIDRFLGDIGAIIVPARRANLDAVLNRYFERQPPFSSKKKEEFPDAIALLSLERWARENGQLLVVSGDNDWKEFAAKSIYMGHVATLGEALQHFQPHLTQAAKLAVKLFKRFAEGPDLELPNLFWEALQDEVTSQNVVVTAWHSEFEVGVETSEILPRRPTVYADTSRLRIVGESENQMAVEIPIGFEGDLQVNLELMAGPAKLGDMTLATSRYVQGLFLVHLAGDFSSDRVDEIRVETLSRPLGVVLGLVDEFFSEQLEG